MSARLLDPVRRRIVLALLATPFTIRTARAAQPDTLAFEVFRNGRRIGRQETRMERAGDSVVVNTHAEMSVGLGPIALYRYRHDAQEVWDAGAFSRLITRTDQNGKLSHVSAEHQADGVIILGAQGKRIVAPAAAVPFSHWNRAIAGRPLFNPQDGAILREQAQPPRPIVIRTASGTELRGVRIGYRGDAEIDDDYDETGAWAALTGTLSDGSRVDYRRV